MSQRESGFEREKNDFYPTPAWVTEALLPHLPPANLIWEPAAGQGGMVEVLKRYCDVISTDLTTGQDFLWTKTSIADGIVTNPPYSEAQQFIEHALELTKPFGFVAMLLRTDYDHAKTRRHLFGGSAQFAKKIVLTRRIVWFERPNAAAPSFNHAWFVWSWTHAGPPVLAYA